MKFDAARIMAIKEDEALRFATTDLPVGGKDGTVASRRGQVRSGQAPLEPGSMAVDLRDGTVEVFPSITAMLDVWIGD